jgi:hypothetical protein
MAKIIRRVTASAIDPDGGIIVKSNFANTIDIKAKREKFRALLKPVFNNDLNTLKEFENRGQKKVDYITADTKTVKPEKKKEFSYRAKMKAIAAKINSSKSSELNQISEHLGSLNLWSYKNVDLVFENLNEFKN